MRRFFTIFLSVFLCISAAAQYDPQDVERYQGLDSLLTEFYQALEHDELEVKCSEMDTLIGSCTDSLTRQHVTLQIFDHYSHSRLMGEEAVAIHVFDNWVANGPVKTRSEFEQMEFEIFVNFNRHSLIGMKAAKVSLFKPHGGRMTIPEDGKVAVLFFYDTSCSKCRLESQLLPKALDAVDFPMDFYAVYAGTDKKQWKRFRHNFKIPNKQVKLVHLWDPDMDSDYQRMYGVTGTPRMYVVWEDGEIIGRRLEVVNLQELIQYIRIAYGKEA